MDLDFTHSENAFREECRSWLEANVSREPLPSGDTKEGFALHLQWEHKLFDAGWAAVSWPKQYGGGGQEHHADGDQHQRDRNVLGTRNLCAQQAGSAGTENVVPWHSR